MLSSSASNADVMGTQQSLQRKYTEIRQKSTGEGDSANLLVLCGRSIVSWQHAAPASHHVKNNKLKRCYLAPFSSNESNGGGKREGTGTQYVMRGF